MSNSRPDHPEPIRPGAGDLPLGAGNGAPGGPTPFPSGRPELPPDLSESEALAYVEGIADRELATKVRSVTARNAELEALLEGMRRDRTRLQELGPTSSTGAGTDGTGLASALLGTSHHAEPNASRTGRLDEPMPLEPVGAGDVSLVAQHSGEVGPDSERRALELDFGDSIPFERLEPRRSRLPMWSGIAAAIVGFAGVGLVVYAMLPALSWRPTQQTAQSGDPADTTMGAPDQATAATTAENDVPDASPVAPLERLAQHPTNERGRETSTGISNEPSTGADTLASAAPPTSPPERDRTSPGEGSLSYAQAARAARDGRLVIEVSVDPRGRQSVRSLAVDTIMGGRAYTVAGPLPLEYRDALVGALEGGREAALEPGDTNDANDNTDVYAVTVRSTPQAVREVGLAIERVSRGRVRFARAPIELTDATPRAQMNLWTGPSSSPGGRVSAAIRVTSAR